MVGRELNDTRIEGYGHAPVAVGFSMPLSAPRWKQFAESRYAHEREALEFLRDVLQDRDPNFLYSNFEFIADDGSVNEIDALIVTQAGVFLVELKSRGGIVTGSRHLWDWDKEGLEFLHVFQDNNSGSYKSGPFEGYPREAANLLIYGLAAFRFAEVLAVGGKPREAYGAAGDDGRDVHFQILSQRCWACG